MDTNCLITMGSNCSTLNFTFEKLKLSSCQIKTFVLYNFLVLLKGTKIFVGLLSPDNHWFKYTYFHQLVDCNHLKTLCLSVGRYNAHFYKAIMQKVVRFVGIFVDVCSSELSTNWDYPALLNWYFVENEL
ncbi:hypothetical protein T01_11008 [Trichinella spiralis]|uniref:Uncharacterized protein n=1 Tax=Trichinella spiralis TaxID=6334 RepID=A0A0V1AV67_TRISP|nr:hypothetical protein T01_11008 [Trichinella spiralis]